MPDQSPAAELVLPIFDAGARPDEGGACPGAGFSSRYGQGAMKIVTLLKISISRPVVNDLIYRS
jgi:hypothetical protein